MYYVIGDGLCYWKNEGEYTHYPEEALHFEDLKPAAKMARLQGLDVYYINTETDEAEKINIDNIPKDEPKDNFMKNIFRGFY